MDKKIITINMMDMENANTNSDLPIKNEIIIHEESQDNGLLIKWIAYEEKLAVDLKTRILNQRKLIRKVYVMDDVYNYLDKEIGGLPNIEQGMNLIGKAIKNKETIGILGDYDVDGICSTSMLNGFLKSINHPAVFFIGDRKDGYGPTMKAFDDMRQRGAKIFIILDSGTVAKDIIDLQQEPIIVIDHHIPDITHQPKDAIIINPQLNDHIMKYCCTGGLVFAFIYSIGKMLNITVDYESFISLAGLTTVCDVMHLSELNGMYVQLAVSLIKQGKCPMIFNYLIHHKLVKKINCFNEEDLGFFIGPHINSIGRLCSNKIIHQFVKVISEPVSFIIEKKEKISIISEENCKEIASNDMQISEFIECLYKTFFPGETTEENRNPQEFIKYMGNVMMNLNLIRKQRQNMLVEEIKNTANIVATNKNRGIFAFYSQLLPSFLGIVGIAAAKVCDEWHKPTFIGIRLDNKIKGSIRSIDGVSAGAMMIECKKNGLVIDGGGHSKAGGFTVSVDKWEQFVEFCNSFAIEALLHHPGYKQLEIDGIFSIHGLNYNMIQDLESLRPFGEGNSKLNLMFVNCTVLRFTTIKNTHLLLTIEVDKIRFDQKNKTISCWYFFFNNNKKILGLISELSKKDSVLIDIVCNIVDDRTIHMKDFRHTSLLWKGET